MAYGDLRGWHLPDGGLLFGCHLSAEQPWNQPFLFYWDNTSSVTCNHWPVLIVLAMRFCSEVPCFALLVAMFHSVLLFKPHKSIFLSQGWIGCAVWTRIQSRESVVTGIDRFAWTHTHNWCSLQSFSLVGDHALPKDSWRSVDNTWYHLCLPPPPKPVREKQCPAGKERSISSISLG